MIRSETMRSRKDNEPLSAGPTTTVSRIRRESERSRSDAGTYEAPSVVGQRATTINPPVVSFQPLDSDRIIHALDSFRKHPSFDFHNSLMEQQQQPLQWHRSQVL